MSERYIYNQAGMVEEMPSFSKAVLGFTLHGVPQRALLWVKNYVHQGELQEKTDSFHGKLKPGDPVTFHCHPYDKEENRDLCSWFAALSWSAQNNDEQQTVVNQQGLLVDVEAGKGVMLFNFFDKEEHVYFIRSKYFSFGQRASSKHPLSGQLSDGDMVQFDATRCTPSPDNKDCSWLARVVWKGKKPANCLFYIDGPKPERQSTTPDQDDEDDDDDDEESTAKLGADHLYKEFEVPGTVRDAPGRVECLLSEEAGFALWLVSPNCWETVFFHRSCAYLDDICLSKYALQESYEPESTMVQITAVPAVSGFPCKWVARKVVATS